MYLHKAEHASLWIAQLTDHRHSSHIFSITLPPRLALLIRTLLEAVAALGCAPPWAKARDGLWTHHIPPYGLCLMKADITFSQDSQRIPIPRHQTAILCHIWHIHDLHVCQRLLKAKGCYQWKALTAVMRCSSTLTKVCFTANLIFFWTRGVCLSVEPFLLSVVCSTGAKWVHIRTI